jgi:hypothetical protein
MESTVASGGPLDIDSAAGLLLALPVEFVANLRQVELAFPVRARSDLQELVLPIRVLAANHFPLNAFDVALTVLHRVEAAVLEVLLIGLSEVVLVGVGQAVVLFDVDNGAGIQSLGVAVSKLVHIDQVFVELVG